MTLDQAIVDLRQVFTQGQAYVAISRVRSLQGLQLLNFAKDVVHADPKVLQWFNEFSNIPLPNHVMQHIEEKKKRALEIRQKKMQNSTKKNVTKENSFLNKNSTLSCASAIKLEVFSPFFLQESNVCC
jgi:hypothetical protein